MTETLFWPLYCNKQLFSRQGKRSTLRPLDKSLEVILMIDQPVGASERRFSHASPIGFSLSFGKLHFALLRAFLSANREWTFSVSSLFHLHSYLFSLAGEW